MTSETYPNGMTVTPTTNKVGEATGLDYKKATLCTSGCTWFTDTIVPSIHGETLTQSSPLASESYKYDTAGRLTDVEETPVEAEPVCKNRGYEYDQDSNRVALISYADTETRGCATTQGYSSESHTYDPGDRLADTGVTYEALGNTAVLPAKDAGGYELASTYYADSQVYQQAQEGQASEYKLDPEARSRETITRASEEIKTITHYSGPGAAASWTSESTGNTNCNIPGIDGSIAAIQTNTAKPLIQIHDLQGNIVANAPDESEVETKPSNLHQSTEFGVPTESKPPKVAWLGALGISSELPGTGTITKDGTTYVPQIGRGIQTQATAPPIPLNAATPFVAPIEPWVAQRAAAADAESIINAEEARRAAEAANQPPGATPLQGWGGCEAEAGGCGEGEGGGGCSGTEACAAGVHHGGSGCKLQLVVGESGGWVYARGWASCGGGLLPQWSELEVCLTMSSPWAPIEPRVCSFAGSGFNPVHPHEVGAWPLRSTLYAHDHMQCASEVGYRAYGWFWLPGMTQGEARHSEHSWGCGATALDEYFNLAWSLVETLSDQT